MVHDSNGASTSMAKALLHEARARLAEGDTRAALSVAERILSLDAAHEEAGGFVDALHAMPRPALSVVIPTCNRVDVLRLCLAHLEAQTLSCDDFEVVVVDDASSDTTPAFLEGYTAPFAFRHLRQPRRGGPARARNRGIAAARGDIVVFLNDDALLCPHGLEIHLATHRAVPDATFSVLGRFDPPTDFSASPWGHVIAHSDLIFNYAGMRHGGVYDFLHYYTCNVSTPRVALIAAGGFDASFTGPLWGAEDIDIGLRLERIDVPVVYREDCTAIHQHDLSLEDMSRMFRVRGGGAVRPDGHLVFEEPCHEAFLLMGMLVARIPALAAAQGIEVTLGQAELMDLFRRMVEFCCRQGIDKSSAEDKHLFHPVEIAARCRTHGFDTRVYANTTLASLKYLQGESPLPPTFFHDTMRAYIGDVCRMPELVPLFDATVAEDCAYIDACSRGGRGPHYISVFDARKI
ncbi:glycosyltransferase family 2 protein [Nitratidesulfovibrio vulgaris]|uniref:glycosyltransferase family 2 protein n=1 Tax=Nitratidesulfovibrio vulgaris TaxID=881 RepID=UPI0023007CFC|nr:glycosyltransferase [Nitratidesulfovibrio vulgaris]WCB46366.1 glycosyltransferase [Nitratidesulfovibrio vulgaris]